MQGDNAYSSIDFIKFEDNSYLDKEAISKLALLNIPANSKKLSVITNHDYKVDSKNSSNLTVSTLGGNDTIVLNGENNYVDAGSEDDKIYSGSGNDTLIGGSGDDTYIFNKEFGKDTIFNAKSIISEKDIIKFNSYINLEELSFKQDRYDLVISLDDANSIRIRDFYVLNRNEAKNVIDSIEFKNGEKINIKTITSLAWCY